MFGLSQHELDEIKCRTPNCDHNDCRVILCGVCHPQAGTKIDYARGTGLLTISCFECNQQIAEIMVKE